MNDLAGRLRDCPLVAIIRGVTPQEVEGVGAALFAAGVRIVEVPLNSPEPIESIRRLVRSLGSRALVGAGTVLDPSAVGQVAETGARLIVSPNTRRPVIAATVAAGMVSLPGYFTPSEAFEAIEAGAHALKLFPAEGATPAMLKAQRAVLPKELPLLVVGGVSPETMAGWVEAGANGFGLGSGVYKPGDSPDQVHAKARAYVAALAARA